MDILIAEDDPVAAELLSCALEEAGHTVVAIVADGREALAYLNDGLCRLIITDWEMPEMDGLEATAAIRQREAATGGHVPIVAMTAHVLSAFRDRCHAAGMDAYLTKPIQADELYEVLCRIRSQENEPCTESTDP